jgi:hypothetical protein
MVTPADDWDKFVDCNPSSPPWKLDAGEPYHHDDLNLLCWSALSFAYDSIRILEQP